MCLNYSNKVLKVNQYAASVQLLIFLLQVLMIQRYNMIGLRALEDSWLSLPFIFYIPGRGYEFLK